MPIELFRNAVLQIAAACLLAFPIAVQAQSDPQPSKLDSTGSFAPIVEELLPATVMIRTYGGYAAAGKNTSGHAPAQDDPTSPEPSGTTASGFIISADGLIVTNAHVVNGAGSITVSLLNGRSYEGILIGQDEHTDIALLAISADEPLQVLGWGNPDSLKPGHRVVVLGNPFGLGLSATEGIIAGLDRDLLTSPYDRFIQIDASVVSGDSGGPLIDTGGYVVGVNTAMMSWCEGCTGMGFAVPADLAMEVAAQLLENGRVLRGYIGAQSQPLTPGLATLTNAQGQAGEIITRVEPASPAMAAGLQPGDIVLAVNGTHVTATQHLVELIAELPEGSVAELSLWRNGTPSQQAIRIASAPAGMAMQEPQSEVELSLFGLVLAAVPADDETRRELAIPADEKGWLLVWTGGAERPGSLAPGDVITHLDGIPLPDLAAFRTAEARLASSRKDAVLARVWRNGSALFVPVWSNPVQHSAKSGAFTEE